MSVPCDICCKDLQEFRNIENSIPEWYGEECEAEVSTTTQEFVLKCEFCKIDYFAERRRYDVDAVTLIEMHIPTSNGKIGVYDYHTKKLIFPKHVNGRDASNRIPINDDEIKNLKRTADGYSKLIAFW